MEILTLAQTDKLERRIPVLLYGSDYWNQIIDFDALARHEMISPDDLELFTVCGRPGGHIGRPAVGAFPEKDTEPPALLSSRTPTGDVLRYNVRHRFPISR